VSEQRRHSESEEPSLEAIDLAEVVPRTVFTLDVPDGTPFATLERVTDLLRLGIKSAPDGSDPINR